ncbi:RNA polymerase subunit sigma-24 [Nibricoccus aquaticus]|uniref:RNA polymerase subunit sigma-24 n=1 Tax=Nibricoccus aquaticus TaxID=2576891 RepID=A0A290Q644_9BACT|nr:sigma-70 family RNA polymerase sigma factor [Nibricoccus aquaticus]ATC63903.1 RNA polymerase subunit sigma-24 [Nibricoccus aquaticus]
MKSHPGSDLADWLALRGGDDEALGRMIARWEKPLFNFAWRYVRNSADARDLSAEVFVKLYQHRERLAEDSNISAWLFTTLVNLCRNRHRWRERHPSVSLDETAGREPVAEAPAPDDAMERKETIEALGAAIDRLPHDLKATLLLHHYEHLSYREIGEVTGCSERGVETRLYRARQRLKDELAGLRVEAGR